MSTTPKICLTIIITCLFVNLLIGELRLSTEIKAQQKVIDELVKSAENDLKLHQTIVKAFERQGEMDHNQNESLKFLLSLVGKPVPAGR